MDATTKKKVMTELENKAVNFSSVGGSQYRIRCPVCGDSNKRDTAAHCYIKCDYDNPGEPILYNCFRCNAHGMVNNKFLEGLGIDPIIKNDHAHYNVFYQKANDIEMNLGEVDLKSPQALYINHRLKTHFDKEDFQRFRIVWSVESLKKSLWDQQVIKRIPTNYEAISFISEDHSTILSRFFDEKIGRWMKMSFNRSKPHKSIYNIHTTIDLFNMDKQITVYIAEGILDAISLYGMYGAENNVYIAVLGSNYIDGMDYLMRRGILGHNVDVVVVADNDIHLPSLKQRLKAYKWMYNSISVCVNVMEKDVGVPVDQIKLNCQKV